MARIVGEKLQGGAQPEVLRRAIVHLIERGRPLSAFPAVVDEVEAAYVRQPGPGPDPPPTLTPEEREAGLRAAREGRKLLEQLSAGIGRPMP